MKNTCDKSPSQKKAPALNRLRIAFFTLRRTVVICICMLRRPCSELAIVHKWKFFLKICEHTFDIYVNRLYNMGKHAKGV